MACAPRNSASSPRISSASLSTLATLSVGASAGACRRRGHQGRFLTHLARNLAATIFFDSSKSPEGPLPDAFLIRPGPVYRTIPPPLLLSFTLAESAVSVSPGCCALLGINTHEKTRTGSSALLAKPASGRPNPELARPLENKMTFFELPHDQRGCYVGRYRQRRARPQHRARTEHGSC